MKNHNEVNSLFRNNLRMGLFLYFKNKTSSISFIITGMKISDGNQRNDLKHRSNTDISNQIQMISTKTRIR